MRDITLGDTFYHGFTTRQFSDGIPTALVGSPVLSVLEENNATPITAGVSVSVSRASVAGLNEATIVATGGNGYEAGKSYSIYISTGTVGGVSVVGEVVGQFTVGASAAFTRIGAAGASLTDLGGMSTGMKSEVESEANDALVAQKLDHLVAQADGDDPVNGSIMAHLASASEDWSTFVPSTDSLQAVRDRGDAEWVTATGFSTHNAAAVWSVATRVLTANTNLNDPTAATIADAVWNEDATAHQAAGSFGQAIGDPGANGETIYDAVVTDAAGTNVAADIIAVKSETATIEGQTDDIGVAGAGLTAINLPNQTMDITGNLSGSVGSVTAEVTADMTKISGDATAADNLELQYDTTGLTGDTFPATQAQVGSIGASAGGALNFEAGEDNSAGTIDPGTTAFVGVETNNYTDTDREDGVYHIIADASNEIVVVYGFSVGGGRTAAKMVFKGFANANNDDLTISAWAHPGGGGWETIGTLEGKGSSSNETITLALLSKHTGTGDEIGKVYIRFNGSGLSANADLNTDQILIEAVGIGQSVGYANGRIWIDTVNGIAGTEPYVNGLADNRTDLLASAKTLSAPGAVGLTDFHLTNGSTITLVESTVMESYFGDNWTLALGSQDVDGAYFQGAHVTGVGISTTEVHYEGCDIGTMSVQKGHFDFCAFGGTVTQTLAGDYEYHNCYSNVAGAGAPTFTKTAGQAITAEWRNWMDSITVSGLQSGDTITINGRLGTVTLNGADATVEIRGSYKSIVNNLTGSPTVNTDGAWKGSDIEDILTDTNELQGDWVNGGRLDLILDARMAEASIDTTAGAVDTVTDVTNQVTADVTAINGNAEAANDLAASARTIVRATVDTATNGHTPTTTEFQADDVTEATADHFNGRIVIFTSGVLKDQATDITDYEAVGGIGQFTVTAMTEPPSNNDTFVVV